MKTGNINQIGEIITPSGAASGNAGSNLSFNLGSGNAAGNSSGGSLNIKPGAASGTGVGGSINVLPFNSTSGSTSALRFYGINSTNFVALKAPNNPTNITWTLPEADGNPDQYLKTNGSGVLFWADLDAPSIVANFRGNVGTLFVDLTFNPITFTGTTGINTVAANSGGVDAVTISMTRTGLTAKTTPVAADQFLMFNSASSNAPVYATASSLISSLNIVTATTSGILVRTGANAYTSRNIASATIAGLQGISVTNGDGTTANPTVGLSINGLPAGSVGPATSIAAFDGTNNTKITPTQIVSARIVRGTFQNAGLTAGSIAITHNLAVAGVLVQVYDETGHLVQPDEIILTSNNVATVELTSFGTITGTWSYVIFG